MDENEFDYYKRTKMPVIAYSSQAKGFFSKMAEEGESALSEKAKARYLCDENLSRLETIKRLSEKYNCSTASLICAAFCSFNVPEVFPIIGGKNVEQIKDSLLGADITLEKDELRDFRNELREVADEIEEIVDDLDYYDADDWDDEFWGEEYF